MKIYNHLFIFRIWIKSILIVWVLRQFTISVTAIEFWPTLNSNQGLPSGMVRPMLFCAIYCGADLATTLLNKNLELVKLELGFIYSEIVEGAYLRKIEQKGIKKYRRLIWGFVLVFLVSVELLDNVAVENPLIPNNGYLINNSQQNFWCSLWAFLILYDQDLYWITSRLLHNRLSITAATGHGQLFTKSVDRNLYHIPHFLCQHGRQYLILLHLRHLFALLLLIAVLAKVQSSLTCGSLYLFAASNVCCSGLPLVRIIVVIMINRRQLPLIPTSRGPSAIWLEGVLLLFGHLHSKRRRDDYVLLAGYCGLVWWLIQHALFCFFGVKHGKSRRYLSAQGWILGSKSSENF